VLDFKFMAVLVLQFFSFNLAFGQGVPGEDPVVLNQRVQRTMLPFNSVTPSAQPTNAEIPAWMDAKLARFQAKVFAADTSGILTDQNIVSTVAQDGLRKVCTQDIGSNIANSANGAFNRFGPKPDAQIVVLRGDLVNICR